MKNSDDSSLLPNLVNIVLLLAGLTNLGVGAASALLVQSAQAAAFSAIGLILLLAATIDRFESLKGLGIEAKTRKLEKKIDEADSMLEELRQLTELTGGALVNLYSKSGASAHQHRLRYTK